MAEETEKERRYFQLQMCEVFILYNIYIYIYRSNTVVYLPANVLVLIVDLFILTVLRICIMLA